MTLPDPCDKCRPFGGLWKEGEKGGMERCICARGNALRSANAPKAALPPVISAAHATMCAEMMSAIPFFPASSGALSAIGNEIAAMCHTPEEAAWLAQRMVRLYRKWPGVQEMRLVFCQKHHPLDGIEAHCASETYPDGIPSESEHDSLAIAAPPPQRRIAGGTAEPISTANSLAATVCDLARAKNLNRVVRGAPEPRVRDIPVLQLTAKNMITPEQIAEAEREIRDSKAKAEVGL